MDPKHPLPCWQVSDSGVCTQRIESSTHLHTLLLMDLSWDYIPFWKIERRTEVTLRRGKRCKQLLDDLKEAIGYWRLKEDTLARTLWKRLWTCRQTDYGMKERNNEFPSTTRSSDISWDPRPPGILQASAYTVEHMWRSVEYSRERMGHQRTYPLITARSPTVLAVYPLTSL